MSAYVPSEAEVEAGRAVLAAWGLRSRHGEWSDRETQDRAAREVLVAAHTVAPDRLARARQWIETCVDPVAVGPARKAAMLAFLDGDGAVPDDLADLPRDVAPTPREDVAEQADRLIRDFATGFGHNDIHDRWHLAHSDGDSEDRYAPCDECVRRQDEYDRARKALVDALTATPPADVVPAAALADRVCGCHLIATAPCSVHGELRDHATTLRLRLDTNRDDPARSALYDALRRYEISQRTAARTAPSEEATSHDD